MAESDRPAIVYGIRPYMFEPESDPDDEETPAEETRSRMDQDVSEWLSDAFMNSLRCHRCATHTQTHTNCDNIHTF